jgi:hypothetical protein
MSDSPGAAPPSSTARLTRSVRDIVICICVLVLLGGELAVAALVGVTASLFLDSCPAATCSSGGAIASVGGAFVVAVLAFVAGIVLVGIRLARRRRAWPFAVGAAVVVVLAEIAGGLLYALATHH